MTDTPSKILEALTHLQRGNFREAVRISGDILERNPQHFDALHLRALAALYDHDKFGALRDIERAISVKCNVPDALNSYGIILKAHDRYEDAIQQFKEALKYKPTHKEASYNIGNCYLEMGNVDLAITFYEASLREDKHNISALNNLGLALSKKRNYHAASRVFSGVIARKPQFADAYHNRGEALAGLGNYEAAIRDYESAIALKPLFPAAHCRRANSLKETGRLLEAQEGYDTAIRQDPQFTEAYLGKALVLKDSGQFDVAVACLDEALALRPDNAEAYRSRGIALKELNRLEEALASYDRAISLKPTYAEVYRNRGNVLISLGRLSEALANYDKAIILKPEYAEAYSSRGNVLMDLERFGEALASYDRAIGLKPDYAEAYSNRGNALARLERLEEALASFDRAISLKPSAISFGRRGRCLAKLMRYEEALMDFESGIERNSQIEDLHLGKATCLSKLGRKKECVTTIAFAKARLKTTETFNYHAAVLQGDNSVSRPPKEFVSGLFDEYATRFEQHLVETLAYNIPEKMYRQFVRHFETTPKVCLDLGCGTGLGGVAYRKCIVSAIGVDLSEKMLNEARQKKVYDELVCSDISEFLERTQKNFDLVISFDVFVYVGELGPIFNGVKRVLKPNGIFALSTEASEVCDYELKETGRYGHSKRYIERLATEYGFRIVALDHGVVRRESGSDVGGYLMHLVSI